MTVEKPPRAPSWLGRDGRRLWRSVVGRYELTPDEAAVLERACRAADECAVLVDVLAEAPAMIPGSAGQMVAHPLRRELRETRAQLARLLAQVELPDHDDDAVAGWDGLTSAQRARRAAHARWDRRGA